MGGVCVCVCVYSVGAVLHMILMCPCVSRGLAIASALSDPRFGLLLRRSFLVTCRAQSLAWSRTAREQGLPLDPGPMAPLLACPSPLLSLSLSPSVGVFIARGYAYPLSAGS